MPRIIAKPDQLDDLNPDFEQSRLEQPVFLNSVPKSGTHLIRNIFRMFVPVSQQYNKAFIQLPNLKEHMVAFDPATPQLSWGHLLFSDLSAIATADAKKIIVVRDPYTWVLARARFFLSDSFQGNLEHLKTEAVSIEQVLNMMIFGIHQKVPSLYEIYIHTAVSWLTSDVKLVKYEDILHHVKNLDDDKAEVFFKDLLAPLNLNTWPDDWRDRVRIGADRKHSGTSRENLYGKDDGKHIAIPDELPDQQKQLVEVAVPNLRALLGYA